MSSVVIRQPKASDVCDLAKRARHIDRLEVEVFQKQDLRSALEQGVEQSVWAACGCWGSELVCIFGVTPASLLGDVGRPWMIGTDAVVKYARPLLRYSRRVVSNMMWDFSRLENYVHPENHTSKRWLEWCGFSFDEPQTNPAFAEPFQLFWKDAA